MALDANELSEKILAIFRDQARTLYPDVVKDVTVTPIPRADGSSTFEVMELRGPLEVDPEPLRPLALAIAMAVVDHIQDSAEVDDTDPGAGGRWRIL